MGVLAHERFGKLKCGSCVVMVRKLTGCPYAVEEDRAKELGGVYTPSEPETWARTPIRFPKGVPAWESLGCPWPQFVEDKDLGGWVNAWDLLKRFGKTPVDLGMWPKVTQRYLEVMLHLDRLADEVQEERFAREQDKLKRQYPGAF